MSDNKQSIFSKDISIPNIFSGISKQGFWLLALLIFVLTLLAYIPAMNAGYVWDDDLYVTNNDALRTLDGLKQIWLQPGSLTQYYPMTYTTFWLEYHLWKLWPAGYHLVNILLHAAVSILLFRILRKIAMPGAWLAAAVFALHPFHVESVAWISERKDVLSGLFILLAFLAWLRFEDSKRKRDYIISLFLFLLALFSKTVTCTFPLFLLLWFWYRSGRVTIRQWFQTVPFFALAVIQGLIVMGVESDIVNISAVNLRFSILERLLIAGRAFWFYVWKIFWPHNLVTIYPRWQLDTASVFQYIFPLAVVLLFAVLWLTRKKTGNGPLMAFACFFVIPAPALGFITNSAFRLSFVADHYQYLGSLSLIILFAAGMDRLFSGKLKLNPRGINIFVSVLLLILFILTARQAAHYKSMETLFGHNIKINPNAAGARTNYASALVKSGRYNEALEHLEAAVKLYPDAPFIHDNLGKILAQLGRHEEALPRFREAVRLLPEYQSAYINLGNSLLRLRRFDEAIKSFEQVLDIDPESEAACNNLANALAALGENDRAGPYYRRAIEINPDYAQAHFNLAFFLERNGDIAAAADHYRESLRIKPDWPEAAGKLAWILATADDPALRDGREAVRLAEKALALSAVKKVEYYKALGAAYVETGDFNKAAEAAGKALEIAYLRNNKKLITELEEKIKLYKTRKE